MWRNAQLNSLMEPSQEYLDAVTKGTQFQEKESAWAGMDSKNYIEEIKCLRKHHKAKTLLDYGCGKGHQYTQKSPPFDQRCGFKSYYLYDPCVSYYNVPPRSNRKFDAIICLQVIRHIPNKDIPWLKELFEHTAKKFVLIGEYDPNIKQKPKKVINADSESRTIDFYREAFADWDSPAELYFHWRKHQCEQTKKDNDKIINIM
tara:strand:- start:476 stop:1084 length:609 start_codon:yes stop_codon:yes gene_type:complete